jgi:Ca2+-binding RTX toxin-like protein
LNVGDRTDEAWPGGEVRLVATNGFVSYVLKTASLPEPADGHWLHVTLDSGPIAAAYAGFELRIEVQQNSAGGTNQILVDDIEVTGVAQLNDGANLDGTPNSGAESSEVIVGSAGNDLIYAQGGDDTVYGDSGNDTIYGGYGIDRLYGGDGSDHMYGGDNPDLMDGGSGDDFLYGESSGSDINGNDQVIGGSGNDFISGGIGIDKLSGGTGDDRIYGDQDTDPFTHGSDGNDYVDGGNGGDILYGDNGDDVLVGGADQDQMFGGIGDDIIRPGDTTGALTIGTDEVLGGDGVTDEGNKPGTLGFDLIDFSDNAVRPGGVTFNLADQQNPAVNVNGIPKQIAAFQTEGLIGSAGNDTLTGDSAGDAGLADATLDKGENWLIGGSGNDTLAGGGGNDIIVGGSIRLDALIGKYNSGYTHNNGNTGLTAADQLQDAQYQGASHRVLYTEDLTDNVGSHQGLLDGAATQGFDKHFTELLRTEMFKDTVLGNSSVAGVADADTGSDTAVYTGNLNKYTIVAVDALGAVVADPHASGFFAVKITDNRTAADLLDANGDPIVNADGNPITLDGTDLVVGVENLKFADKTISPAAYFDKAPVVDLKYQATTQSTQVASDSFTGNGNAYARGTGWGNNNSWTETGDNNSPGNGQILIDTAGSGQNNNPGLHITGGTPAATFDGASLSRAVNLSAYQSAEVSFSVRQTGISGTETVKVYFSASPPTATDTPIYTISSAADSAATVHTLAITGPFQPGARLYFVASAMNATTDDVYIDNISINRLVTVDQFQGNNNTAPYTELGTAAAITTLPHITDPDVIDTTIASAKIVVSDAVAGDVLNVGALPSGIAATGNGTGVNGLTGATQIALSGVALQSVYENVLKTITFYNTTQDPTNHGANLNRHIDVTVSDGLLDSAVATTTVGITAIDNLTLVGADNVITNIAVGTASSANIAIPDWALLANDTDPDTTLSISSIGGGTNGVATSGNGAGHSGTTTTVRDSSAGGGTFTYTVNGITGTVTLAAQQTGTTLTGSANGDIMIGTDATTTINGNGGNDVIFGNGGSDTLTGGAGDDRIVYTVTTIGGGGNPTVTSGRDFIDGGTTTIDLNGRDTGSDTFVLNGSQGSETFKIMTQAEALAHGVTGLNANTEIVITRQAGNVASNAFNGLFVLAELDNIEEIQVNTLAVTANNINGGLDGSSGQGDWIQILGNFGTSTNATTSLNFSTITINGGADDTVDITGLQSDHRIVFNGASTTSQVMGELRPQDVVNLLGTAPSNPVDTDVPPPQLPPTDPVWTGDPGATDGEDDGDTLPPLSGNHEHEGQHEGGQHHDYHAHNHQGEGSDYDMAGGHHRDHTGYDSTPSTDTSTDTTSHAPVAQSGTAADDVLIGGSGDDVYSGGSGDDLILGNDGADTIKGGGGDDLIKGGAGNDVLFGNDGNDDLFGGSGKDLMTGDAGDDRLFGDAGDDALEGGTGNDTVYGGAGNDRVIATVGDGDDTYFGDTEEDTLDYSAISANITADLGNGIGQHGSVTSAQSGSDKVFGFEDFIGGSGNDTIVASSVANVMDGSGGNDTFVFGSAGDADGDTIKGFQPGDKIDLSAIDANTGTSGSQSFVLFAGNVFTSAGQVIVTHEIRDGAEHTIVAGNTNNDTVADFKLDIAGDQALTFSDFNGVH